MELLLALIFILPLSASIITGVGIGLLEKKEVKFITNFCVFLSCIFSWILLIYLYKNKIPVMSVTLFDWMEFGNYTSRWTVTADMLTAVMLVVVTTVSFLVHFYSLGYMASDHHPARFMCYLSMFTTFMILLVCANNLLQLFIGWEGVGLCSYLLIGFWYRKNSASTAAFKAFIVNRVADVAMVIGIVACYYYLQNLDFANINAYAPELTKNYITIFGSQITAADFVCLMLFIGCMGKSAQLGFHVWLPDAMEGPTPVSALIHAATMVTAGIVLICRLSPLFELSPMVMDIIVIVGALTAIFAATIAITKTDIKKIIAYSTCSQLGYMFFACGLGVYQAGMFHLFTHAFFKALLFLSAGAVIYALHHEQDIRRMGNGLYKKIPVVYAVMLIGTLAIVGVYPFAGYYSKDMIIESGLASHGQFAKFAAYVGIIVAFLTSFYSFRLFFVAFHGSKVFDKKTKSMHDGHDHTESENEDDHGHRGHGNGHHSHKVPFTISAPIFILAIFSICSGYLGGDVFGMVGEKAGEFWNGALARERGVAIMEHAHHHLTTWQKLIPSFCGLAGFILAYICYLNTKINIVNAVSTKCKYVYKLLFNGYFIDEIYQVIIVRPMVKISRVSWKFLDTMVIDFVLSRLTAISSLKLSAAFVKCNSGFISKTLSLMMVCLVIFSFIALYSNSLYN